MLSWTGFCFFNMQWSAVESKVWFYPMVVLGLLALVTKPTGQKPKEEEEDPRYRNRYR